MTDYYTTDPIQTNGVPYSFTSMPGLFSPFNSLRLLAGGQIISEMGSQAADDELICRKFISYARK